MKAKQITHSLVAKIIAYFLIVIFAVLAMASVFGGILMLEGQFYTQNEEQIKKSALYSLAEADGYYVLDHLITMGDEKSVEDYFKNSNFTFEFFAGKGGTTTINSLVLKEGDEIGGTYNGEATKYSFEIPYITNDNIRSNTQLLDVADEYVVKAYIDDTFPFPDKYSNMNKLIEFAYPLRYGVIVSAVVGALLAIACFLFLMCAAGHKAGHEDIVRRGVARIPLDLLTGIMLFTLIFTASGILDAFYYQNDITGFTVVLCICILILLIPFTAYCMILAVNFKYGGWWKNTVVYQAVIYLWRGFKVLKKVLGHGFQSFGKGMSALIGTLPILWKAALALVVITGLELIFFLIFHWEPGLLLLFWSIEKIILIPLILYVVLILKKLQKGGEKLAAGDLSYQVNTSRMFWDLKEHGENLNSIAGGMTFAVEERMKSERFKTELITNVSHDIKTPLTSIINYVDLIGKEKSDNEKISEYSEVLLRQSERLKKLIEDLVEASKASTGNIDVILAPCEIGVLLTQTAGEYEQKLQNGNLELIVRQPEAPVKIMADGRHMWRIFDNLLSNVCKYSQGGTRVYLSVEREHEKAVISFKNTSSYALDIPEGALIERFVRGDTSRNTEGSGLGLSIAKSLTELQGGNLELAVDGDLFKVTLKFKVIN